MNYDTVMSGNTIQQGKQMNYSYIHHHNGPYKHNAKPCRHSLVSHRIDPKAAKQINILFRKSYIHGTSSKQGLACSFFGK